MQVLIVSLSGDGVVQAEVISDLKAILSMTEMSLLPIPEDEPLSPILRDLMPPHGISYSAVVEERVEQLSQAQVIRFSRPRVSQSNLGLMTALRAIFHEKNHWRIKNIR